MGSCLSKKGSNTITTTTTTTPVTPRLQPMVLPITTASRIVHGNAAAATEPPQQDLQGNFSAGHGNFTPKKEVFLIKHRKSHDRDFPLDQKSASGIASHKSPEEAPQVTHVTIHPLDNHDKQLTVMRTSSCTKEEVDAILIQCGRLSRSSSGNFGGTSYSGSKRSYDFDNHDDADGRGASESVPRGCQFPDLNKDDPGRRRSDRCQSRPSPTCDRGGRRRTPSRERDQQRSSSASRERRMSCSPGRRADNTTNASLSNATANGGGSKLPTKMVSVPATVSGTDKNKSNLEPKVAAVRRISVKRNLGGAGPTASPRSQSPVKQTTTTAKAADNDIQQPSLSRSSSRKAEKSPYRRNPLGEIDPNTFSHPQTAALLSNHKCHAPANKENEAPPLVKAKLCADKWKSEIAEDTCALEEGKAAAAQDIPQKEPIVQASTAVGVDPDDVHQTLARIKSSQEFGVEKDRRQGSYTSLLLQDIQKFHQNHAGPTSFSLPPCVVKACSIYDAVAGLNLKRSCIYNEPTAFSSRLNIGTSFTSAKSEAKDPFVESELAVDDDLVEPSILKYVTVKRGGMLGKEVEEQESSGSNTLFLGSAGAEPGLAMADSPNCSTSISAGTRMSAISGKGLLYG